VIRSGLVLCALGALVITSCGRSGKLTAVIPDTPQSQPTVETSTPIQSTDAALALDGANALGLNFFPLKIGNRWQYDRRLTVQIVTTDAPEAPLVVTSRVSSRLTGFEVLFGRRYVVEESRTEEDGSSDVTVSWIRYRQDASGLYEADIASTLPPGAGNSARDPRPETMAAARQEARGLDYVGQTIPERAQRALFQLAWSRLTQRMERARQVAKSLEVRATNGNGNSNGNGKRRRGVLDHEILRLRYPLFPGANWTVREEPFFGAVVEAFESSAVPAGSFPGHRIKITTPLFGDRDEVRVWYGKKGFLKLEAHGEEVVTDPDGNLLGAILFDQEDVLSNLDLVAMATPRRSAPPPRRK
jgi:hypothetical protein